MRAFSTEDDGKRGRFFDFLRSANKVDEEVKASEKEPTESQAEETPGKADEQ